MYNKLIRQLKNDRSIDCKMIPPRYPYQYHDSVIAFILYSKDKGSFYVAFRDDGELLDHKVL
jgi:hypothetical protein